jgi:hypothetical protein
MITSVDVLQTATPTRSEDQMLNTINSIKHQSRFCCKICLLNFFDASEAEAHWSGSRSLSPHLFIFESETCSIESSRRRASHAGFKTAGGM